MKLYEITAALLWLADSDELTPDLEAQLDALQMERADKADGICKLVRNMEAEAAALTDEADRFYSRAQKARNSVTRLKAYLKGELEKTGTTHLDAGLFKIRIQRNSQPSVIVDRDPRMLPPEFQRVTVEAAKLIIIDTLEAGQPLPDGVTVERGTHLRIT